MLLVPRLPMDNQTKHSSDELDWTRLFFPTSKSTHFRFTGQSASLLPLRISRAHIRCNFFNFCTRNSLFPSGISVILLIFHLLLSALYLAVMIDDFFHSACFFTATRNTLECVAKFHVITAQPGKNVTISFCIPSCIWIDWVVFCINLFNHKELSIFSLGFT